MNSEPKIIVVNESTFQSIASDIFSFGTLIGAFWVNYQFLGDGIILQLVLAFVFIIMSMARGARKTIRRMNVEQAREYFCQPTEPEPS